MPIPKKKVKVALEKAEPSKVTPEELQQELRENMGLHCKYTEIPELKKLKEDVLERWGETGTGQSYGIFIKENGFVQAAGPITHLNIKGVDLLAHFGFSDEDVKGEWEPSDTAQGYRNELFTIQSSDNFWYLKNNFPDFAGVYNHKEDTRKVDTVEAVKSFFVEIGKELAGLSVSGIDKVSLEPVLKKALGVSAAI